MKFLTDDLLEKLISNFNQNWTLTCNGEQEVDFTPVMKLFTPAGSATWLLTELDDETYSAFGLCDLGFGEPELGWVSLKELAEVEAGYGLPVERDLHFVADKTMSQYAEEAKKQGRVVA